MRLLCMYFRRDAGNITAYWNGYREYRAANQTTRLPRMMGFRLPARRHRVGHVIEGLRRGHGHQNRQSGQLESALTAVQESSGASDMVTDEEILSAYAMVAMEEGVFVNLRQRHRSPVSLKDSAGQ